MGYANGLNGERANGELFARSNFNQLDLVEQPVLFELALHVGQREFGGINRNLQLAENPGQAADVVFVPVGEHDGAHMLLVLDEIGDVGHDNIDAEKFRLGKHQSRVDHEDVIFVAEGEAVHAELAEAA